MIRRLVSAAVVTLACIGRPLALSSDPASWKQVRTPHFTIYSSAGEETARATATKLETFRAVLGRITEGLRMKAPVPTVVFVFRNAEEFDPYKGDRSSASRGSLAGFFLPGPEVNYLAIDSGAAQDSWRVVYHECVHQVLNDSFAKAPLWVHEGMAEFYSTFTCENAVAKIGLPVREHVQWLRRNALIPLSSLFFLRQDSSDYNETGRVGVFYAESWALAHYLLKGSAERDGQLKVFLRLLERGQDPVEAFRSAFKTIYGGLEKELSDYVKNDSFPYTTVDLVELHVPEPEEPRPVAPSEILTQLGGLLARLGEGSAGDAEEHFRKALSFDPNDARAKAGLASLMRTQKRPERASELLEEAEALAPSDTQVLLAKAKDVLARVIGDEGRRFQVSKNPPAEVLSARDLLKRVLEAEPDNVEANRELGMVCLLGGEQISVGVEALEKANRLAPLRGDVAFTLLQLYARQGNRDKATALLEKGLRRTASPEMLDSAREVLLEIDLKEAESLARQWKYEEALVILRRVRDTTQDLSLRERLDESIRRLERAAERKN